MAVGINNKTNYWVLTSIGSSHDEGFNRAENKGKLLL
jgi:hypothetical protein